MTEEEKRQLALDFLAAEKQRLATATFADHRASEERDAHRRINSNQRFYASFAQQGITIKEFQKAYSDAYRRGERDMLNYRFNFFYAATVIAYHEAFFRFPGGSGFVHEEPGHSTKGMQNT